MTYLEYYLGYYCKFSEFLMFLLTRGEQNFTINIYIDNNRHELARYLSRLVHRPTFIDVDVDIGTYLVPIIETLDTP